MDTGTPIVIFLNPVLVECFCVVWDGEWLSESELIVGIRVSDDYMRCKKRRGRMMSMRMNSRRKEE